MADEPSDATIEAAIREILEGAKLDDITHGIIRNKVSKRYTASEMVVLGNSRVDES